RLVASRSSACAWRCRLVAASPSRSRAGCARAGGTAVHERARSDGAASARRGSRSLRRRGAHLVILARMSVNTETIAKMQQIVLAGPRGFCAGVDRAIDIVELALRVCPYPVYVRKEIVHNRHVVEALRAKGAHFVDELDEVPDGATVIFSAHGISPAVRDEAERRGLRVIDATCPLVTKVHLEAI